MPVLNRRNTPLSSLPHGSEGALWMEPENRAAKPYPFRGLLETCANPVCSSGWLQIWRSRSYPIFEGGWNCSPECTAQRLQSAVARELDGRVTPVETHRHRIPLGLLMLEQGWITSAQLRGALEGQRADKAGRLGHWLMAREGVSEQLLTRALGLQWSCPVLSLEFHDPDGLSPMLPRLFIDAFRALPLRIAAGKLVYLGFDDRLDPALALALERMSSLRVESGVVQGSRFRSAHSRMLEARFPSVELLEAASGPALVRALSRVIEKVKPVESRLVRVHDCLWLRLWRKPQTGAVPDVGSVHDVICTISL